MTDKIKNDSGVVKRFFGLHMVEGVAQYLGEGGEPYRILILEEVLKRMDSTFEGRPVFVGHQEANLERLREQADGYVVKSFFNKSDGKHWAEFIVVSDKGLEAIRNGWRLSNAYKLKQLGQGGRWHAVDYEKTVEMGEYDHLAIVDDPRYSESIILSPEEFQEYNRKKEAELAHLTNSNDKPQKKKGEIKMPIGLNFFKKQKVENSEQVTALEELSIKLPKSGREVDLITLINEADASAQDVGFANGSDKVKVGDKEMNVDDLVKEYNSLCAMKNEWEGEERRKKENSDKEDKEKKENKNEDDKEKKAENSVSKDKKHFDLLMNAGERGMIDGRSVVETSHDRVARGKDRY